MENAAQQNQQASQATQPALPLRRDTFFGVCQAIGDDFHIPANLIRIAFAGLFFWNMVIGIAAYFGIGAVVALSRWLYPAPRATATVEDSAPAAAGTEQQPESASDEMSLAA